MTAEEKRRIAKLHNRAVTDGDLDIVHLCRDALAGGKEATQIALQVYRDRHPAGIHQIYPDRMTRDRHGGQ